MLRFSIQESPVGFHRTVSQKLTPCFSIRDLNLFYGRDQALKSIDLSIPKHKATAFIGPSGCGKSTLLRCFNRMNDLIDNCTASGVIELEGENILAPDIDVTSLRQKVGMVFQKPNPLPKTIFENVVFGLRVQGIKDREQLAAAAERSLTQAALWDEVKDRLNTSAFSLSGGQQQRLVLARALAVEPEVILLDEPASALDPRSTAKIEELIVELKNDYTIVIVTHNMQQAARVSDYTVYMYLGEIVEFGGTKEMFTVPQKKATQDYIGGRHG